MIEGVYQHIDKLPERELRPGVHLRILAGSHVMLSIVRFDPHATVETHHHPHEQLGFVLEGELEQWIGNDRRRLRQGDVYAIPSNLPHGARTHETTALVLDAFHPVREEYLKLFAR